MRRSLLIFLAAATPLAAQQQQSSAAASASVLATKGVWSIGHNYVLRSAEQMPESLYAFRPAPTVRTFGQLVGHVADAEGMFCALALGETPANNEYEKKTSKADLVAALKASAAVCERAYAQTDAASSAPIKIFGRDGTRMFALSLNAAHDMEHYGNLVTYIRIKGMVPPSSQQ
jgi:uncharacterized damage-inducible protein DinB